ncbi:MAG TPA: porin family protein [Mucilaginibacter sp.]|nr:porin family protein [Mucilaginibacter sp.]
MKKIILSLAVFAATITLASAQVIPSFQLGIKGGVNFSKLSSSSTFSSSNRAGYLGGLWARVGALGFNFQPELYVTAKNVEISDNGTEGKAKFTSIDVPLLFGGKVGAFGFGGRFYTGPLVSFKINDDQNFGTALGNAATLHYKDQNFAWVFGAGVDIRNISLDLRYEAGITKQTYGNSSTRVSLFNLTLAVPIFKL